MKRLLVIGVALALAPAAWAGWDTNGFDSNGYDCNGWDSNGWDSNGFDMNGYDRNGTGVDGVSFDLGRATNRLFAGTVNGVAVHLTFSNSGRFEVVSKGSGSKAAGCVVRSFPDGAAILQAISTDGRLLLLHPPNGDPPPPAAAYGGPLMTLADGVATFDQQKLQYILDLGGGTFHLIAAALNTNVIANGTVDADGTLHGVLEAVSADGSRSTAQLTLRPQKSGPNS